VRQLACLEESAGIVVMGWIHLGMVLDALQESTGRISSSN